MQTKNDKQSFTFSFSMKILATRGKYQTICEQTNKEHKLNADFLIVPFANHTNHYMQMQIFLFSSFNVMNEEKKLSALNQQKQMPFN